jgi:anti-sigma B factor antagonist
VSDKVQIASQRRALSDGARACRPDRDLGNSPRLLPLSRTFQESGPVPNHFPPQTEIVDYAHGDAPGLTVRGEIDIATSPELALALDRAILASIGAFVLDLRELEFLDSSGLHVVLQARTALADQARQLAIVCPPGPVRRVMEVACVDHCLLLVDAPADVAAALDPAE